MDKLNCIQEENGKKNCEGKRYKRLME